MNQRYKTQLAAGCEERTYVPLMDEEGEDLVTASVQRMQRAKAWVMLIHARMHVVSGPRGPWEILFEASQAVEHDMAMADWKLLAKELAGQSYR